MKKEVVHPNYNDRTTRNDFNLVFLERATDENVALVKVNSNDSLPNPGGSVVVMGWGDTTAADDKMWLSDTLRAVEVKVISNSECEKSEGEVNGFTDTYADQIFDSMLCASDPNQGECCGGS